MQTGENNLYTPTEQAPLQESDLLYETCGTAPATPLEYLLLSWDQFVNELEFE